MHRLAPAGREDPKSQERYKRKIKLMTEEKHARFIDYDCNTGVWKFAAGFARPG